MSRCQYDSLTFNRPVISDRHDMMVIGVGRERVGGEQHEKLLLFRTATKIALVANGSQNLASLNLRFRQHGYSPFPS
jgi:hypothetical protein